MDQDLRTEAVTAHQDAVRPSRRHAQFGDLTPAALRSEARRGVLDWIGCALAGSGHGDQSATLLDVLQRGGRANPQATVLGRNLKLGLLDAPLANGQMGHLLDYDDTHMGGVVLHTSSPVLAALFALAERAPVSGEADLMLAYAVGFEAGVRTGPHRAGPSQGRLASHRHAGQHRGRRRRRQAHAEPRSPSNMTYALGIAATQAAGMQQNRGTMCKSFHAGKAASQRRAGRAAGGARLRQRRRRSSKARRGFSRIYSDDRRA